jgi:hypothetical protein
MKPTPTDIADAIAKIEAGVDAEGRRDFRAGRLRYRLPRYFAANREMPG